MAFPAVIEAWLGARAPNTARSYRGVTSEWLKSLSGVPFERAREVHALQFVREQRERGHNAATLHRKVVILSTLYSFLQREGVAKSNPFSEASKTIPRGTTGLVRPHGILSVEECRALLSAPSPATCTGVRDRAIFALLLGGALRISELLSLSTSSIVTHGDAISITISATKSGGSQSVVLSAVFSEPVLALLKRRLEESSENSPLIVTYDRDGTPRGRMSLSSLFRLVKGYYKAVGVSSSMTVHSTRATAITRLLVAGLPYREVQEFSRHSSVLMVEKYDKRRFGVADAPGRKLIY